MRIAASIALLLTPFAAANVPATDEVPIALAMPPHETATTLDCSPTAGFSPVQALIIANAIRVTTHRDVILRRVEPTGSMRPYFDENAVLLLEAAPFAELKVGDVVTFHHPLLHAIVVHRLVEKRGDVFWSRGDHNARMDSVFVTPQNYERRLAGIVYMHPDGVAGAEAARAAASDR